MTYYRQCLLSRGYESSVRWIPEKFAVIGKSLRLKDDDGRWEDGWVVKGIYEQRDELRLPDAHKAIRQHRRNTGDAAK